VNDPDFLGFEQRGERAVITLDSEALRYEEFKGAEKVAPPGSIYGLSPL